MWLLLDIGDIGSGRAARISKTKGPRLRHSASRKVTPQVAHCSVLHDIALYMCEPRSFSLAISEKLSSANVYGLNVAWLHKTTADLRSKFIQFLDMSRPFDSMCDKFLRAMMVDLEAIYYRG